MDIQTNEWDGINRICPVPAKKCTGEHIKRLGNKMQGVVDKIVKIQKDPELTREEKNEKTRNAIFRLRELGFNDLTYAESAVLSKELEKRQVDGRWLYPGEKGYYDEEEGDDQC